MVVIAMPATYSADEYLALDTNRPVELVDGHLEFPPPPDELHQELLVFVLERVRRRLTKRGRGKAIIAPFPLRVGLATFRQPDLCLLLNENDPRRGRKFWAGADLIVEVVHPDDPERDYCAKRKDYAQASVSEYWIVDPQKTEFLVLRLAGERYVEH